MASSDVCVLSPLSKKTNYSFLCYHGTGPLVKPVSCLTRWWSCVRVCFLLCPQWHVSRSCVLTCVCSVQADGHAVRCSIMFVKGNGINTFTLLSFEKPHDSWLFPEILCNRDTKTRTHNLSSRFSRHVYLNN